VSRRVSGSGSIEASN